MISYILYQIEKQNFLSKSLYMWRNDRIHFYHMNPKSSSQIAMSMLTFSCSLAFKELDKFIFRIVLNLNMVFPLFQWLKLEETSRTWPSFWYERTFGKSMITFRLVFFARLFTLRLWCQKGMSAVVQKTYQW